MTFPQPLEFKQFYPRSFKITKNWDKSSLNNDLMPGDLSYENINLSEKSEFYVDALIPPISPTIFRVGDKIFNMSQIPGREKSVIFTDYRQINTEESLNSVVLQQIAVGRVANITVESDIPTKVNHLKETIIFDNVKTVEPLEMKITDICHHERFMTMFNNDLYSDLFVLLKSGDVLKLHKFVLAAWGCNSESIKESQYFEPSIEDDIVKRLFKHLYSEGKFLIDDIIDSEDIKDLCKKFGINHKLLQRSQILCEIKPVEQTNTVTSTSGSSVKSASEMHPNIINDQSYSDFFSNIDFIHSTPYCQPARKSALFPEKDTILTQALPANISDSNLFNSQDISIDFSIVETQTENPNQSNTNDIFKKKQNNKEILNSTFPSFEEMETIDEPDDNENGNAEETDKKTLSDVLKDFFASSLHHSQSLCPNNQNRLTDTVSNHPNTTPHIDEVITIAETPEIIDLLSPPLSVSYGINSISPHGIPNNDEIITIDLSSDEEVEINKDKIDNNVKEALPKNVNNRKQMKRKLSRTSSKTQNTDSKKIMLSVDKEKFKPNSGIELSTDCQKISEFPPIDNVSSKDCSSIENLYRFLKTNYFLEILTYQALDTTKIVKELKLLNIDQDLRTLVTYFDNQCIAYFRTNNTTSIKKGGKRKTTTKKLSN